MSRSQVLSLGAALALIAAALGACEKPQVPKDAPTPAPSAATT